MSDKEHQEGVEIQEEEFEEINEDEGEVVQENPEDGQAEEENKAAQKEGDKEQQEGDGANEGEGGKDEGEGNDGEGEDDNYDPDLRSVYVKNVDYSADPNSLKEHFQECGGIARVTIICNKITGQPLGYAYIEFETTESVDKAIELMNDTLFKGRQITVLKKRKNLPGRGRGGFRSRFPGFGRGFFPRRPYFRGRYGPY
ncbi:unnamed protein product [Moneuplotes crassus]|uniref:RRM domain-containing protein n=1 Tax=Euplotes crassus TaxID=5936 RepID=A0AAD2D4B5_EUPCR|nr:unnamed protein product [Moneuplotes crassus]